MYYHVPIARNAAGTAGVVKQPQSYTLLVDVRGYRSIAAVDVCEIRGVVKVTFIIQRGRGGNCCILALAWQGSTKAT